MLQNKACTVQGFCLQWPNNVRQPHNWCNAEKDVVSVTAAGGQLYCASPKGITDEFCNCPIYRPSQNHLRIMSVCSTHRAIVFTELNTRNNDISVKILSRSTCMSVWEEPTVLTTFQRVDNSVVLVAVFENMIAAIDPLKRELMTFNTTNHQKVVFPLNRMGKPNGIHMLSADTILVADHNYHTVTKLNLHTDGSTEALWSCEDIAKPSGICTDKSGLIYVASYTKNIYYHQMVSQARQYRLTEGSIFFIHLKEWELILRESITFYA